MSTEQNEIKNDGGVENNISKNRGLDYISQHRKLLQEYHKYLNSFNDPTIYNATEDMIDEYLDNSL